MSLERSGHTRPSTNLIGHSNSAHYEEGEVSKIGDCAIENG